MAWKPRFWSAPTARSSGAPRRTRRRLLLLGLLVLLAAGGWWGHQWYQSSPAVQAQRLAEARARWETRTFESYQMTVTCLINDRHRPGCPGPYPATRDHTYTIRNETEEATDQERFHRRTVSHYFAYLEPYASGERLGTDPPDYPTIMPETTRLYVSYDADLGHPRRIEIVETTHPDWFNPAFWGNFLERQEWQYCQSFLCIDHDITTITIEELTPLPDE